MSTPLYRTRLVVLVLAIAIGAVAFAAATNAKQRFDAAKEAGIAAVDKLGLGVKVEVDASDVLHAGIPVAAGAILLIVVSLASIVMLILGRSRGNGLSTRTLPVQAGVLGFLTLFFLIASVVVTVIVAKRDAKTTATFPNGTAVPQTLVSSLQRQLGISTIYKHRGYLIFLVVSSWIAFLFSALASAISILAWRRSKAAPTTDASSVVVEKPVMSNSSI